MRNAFDRILEDYQQPTKQAAALEEIRSVYPHSICSAKLETFCKLRAGEPPEYDCFTFALDLIDCPERLAARKYAPRRIGPVQLPGIADVLPGPNFLHFLKLPSKPSLQSCCDYDIVVYYDKFGKVQHAGKIVEGVIISKWGMKGALWQHGLWEVPSSYGTSVQFYSHRPTEYVRKRWLAYLDQLARRVAGFTNLVSVMCENQDKNLNQEELLEVAAQKSRSK